MSSSKYPKGSEWRKWDLHIHTPASFHWEGQKFNSDSNSPDNTSLIDKMICALNVAEPAVFAIMDYWTFDGWFALKKRLEQPKAPKLEKIIFPGIELRLVAPMEGRLNAHVLFSNEITDQVLLDFKAQLYVEIIDRPLSNESLITLARHQVGEDLLKRKGFNKKDIERDDDTALQAGSNIAEISYESYKKAIRNVPNQMAIGFMPFSTHDGLEEVKWQNHYAYVINLLNTSVIFETRKLDLWAAFAGVETDGNKNWLCNFQAALKNVPRLAVSGSDAHRFIGEPRNNEVRGYGDYPSGKATWIKANPTFEGLKQAIKEPAKRSFIGTIPPKRQLIRENRSCFIEKLEVNKLAETSLTDAWLDQTELHLNYDLVAIIGNKGSGKSALADIIALLGNSKQSHYFSFLKKNRFRGKTGEPAIHFNAKVTWGDGKELEKNLNDNPVIENVELVKYIPQGYFEELCNAHVSGQSDAFEKELRSVIYSHADNSIRLGSHDFDQLIEKQESLLRSKLVSYRTELYKVNEQIESLENQMTDEAPKILEELLVQNQRLLDELIKDKPKEVPEPTSEPTDEQKKVVTQLVGIDEKLEKLRQQNELNQEKLIKLAEKKKACENIEAGFEIVKRAVSQFTSECSFDALLLDLEAEKLVKLEINEKVISDLEADCINRDKKLKESQLLLNNEKQSLIEEKSSLNKQLNAPQQAFQQYKDQLKVWEEKKTKLLGTKDDSETLEGVKHRKAQLDQLPSQRKKLLEKRLELTRKILTVLDEQKAYREALFKPVQSLIQDNTLIREEYKLQFRVELSSTANKISDKLFSFVKQSSGEFRGESESLSVIKELMDKHDLGNEDSLINFIQELYQKLEDASKNLVGIESLLRKNYSSHEVYDFIFGLNYLEPRYTLMFQGAHIEQLSPGQRGALLLIFYLLVDKGNIPIILDQPEENLDNETIVSLLVPVLTEAKQKRQIIMVTHNPNLAVVCDAEQIIYCEFDRTNGHNITYTSGAIECSIINNKVVDVLEGTMPAFDNRRGKYM